MPDLLFSNPTLAALYDAFCPRTARSDFDFYLPMIMSAESILDVGCGTGSLLHEAKDIGHKGRLCGLDPAIGMLAQARKRSDIEWIAGNLPSVGWRAEFDLIVMTGHAFQVLLTDEDMKLFLLAVGTALKGGGRFAFETRNPAAREWERWNKQYSGEVVDSSGSTVKSQCVVEMPVEGDLVNFSHTYTSPYWDRPMISHSTLRFLDAARLNSFLTKAGLAVEEQYGDWDRSPLSEKSPEIITIARRA